MNCRLCSVGDEHAETKAAVTRKTENQYEFPASGISLALKGAVLFHYCQVDVESKKTGVKTCSLAATNKESGSGFTGQFSSELKRAERDRKNATAWLLVNLDAGR
jgi:hypothetical protein